jgi:type VI secretion system protein ImpH
MVASSWLSIYPVISDLIKEPQKFDFVQALRLLELINATSNRSAAITIIRDPGEINHKIQARFVSDYRMKFPIAAITKTDPLNDNIMQFTISGFGYVGAVGVLPYSFSYLVSLTQSNKNHGLKSFLDIFQNRSVQLFFQAGSKYRITISYDRGKFGDIDKFKRTLESFIGFSFKNIKNKLSIPDENLLYYSGFFSSSRRTIYALETILSDELGLNIHVIPFSGRWIKLDVDDQTSLSNNDLNKHYNCLSKDAVLGERVWSVQNCFRVLVGPIHEERIYPLLPNGSDDIKIRDIVETYCGKEYEYEVQLQVEAKSVPFARLGVGDDAINQCRLGQTSWVLATTSLVDRSDAVFIKNN